MSTEPHREAARRQHRVLGHYLAIQAWLRNLDCVVLTRKDLEAFLGLQRFKSARVEWLKDDLVPWFEFQKAYYKSSSPSSIHSLFLSRVSMEPHLPDGSMKTDERIKKLGSKAPRTEKFILEGHPWVPPTESEMIAQLAVISSGLAVPQDYAAKRKSKTG